MNLIALSLLDKDGDRIITANGSMHLNKH